MPSTAVNWAYLKLQTLEWVNKECKHFFANPLFKNFKNIIGTTKFVLLQSLFFQKYAF